ncbi:MAG TPA: DUF4340 domain-containing protein [Burkholderiaceae bacterium]|nr:DUF4340 domain-containing protein [Burkholderiaceae bacterium]
MQRWITLLGVILGVQVLLAGGLMLRSDRLAPVHSDAPLVAADLKAVDRLTIDGPVAADTAAQKAAGAGARVELVKHDGAWTMPANFGAPADAKKIDTLLKRLAAVPRGLPIATTSDALARFKVGEHDYERRIVASQGDKVVATVYLSSAPGGRKANARTGEDRAVFNVDLATYDLPTGAADWLDKTLLQHDASTLARIEVAEAGKPVVTLQRAAPVAASKDPQASDYGSAEKKERTSSPPAPVWSAEGLAAGQHLDQGRADALVQAIANVRVDGVLGTQEQPDWQQDPPRLRVTIADAANKTVTWTLVKPKAGDLQVLKASDRPWYFELKSWSAQPLLDAAATDKLVAQASAPAPGGASMQAAGSTKPGAPTKAH